MKKLCRLCKHSKPYDKSRMKCEEHFVKIMKRYMDGSESTAEDRACNDWELKVTKDAAKLQKILKEEYNVDIIPVIERVRAGHWQRSEGAWSWMVRTTDDRYNVGSQWALSKVVKADKREYDVNCMDVSIII